eukprot:UN0661
MLIYNLVESIVVFGLVAIFGLHIDINGHASSVDTVSRGGLWAAAVWVGIITNPICHCTIKLLPMLFVATYDLLIQDMHSFHCLVDELFAMDGDGLEEQKDLLNALHQHEHGLRTRLASVNEVMSSGLGRYLASQFAVMFTTFLFGVVAIKKDNGNMVLAGIYMFIAVMNFIIIILLTKGAARVGDRWLQLIDDLDTPIIIVRSTSVLGVSLAEHLRQLQNAGIRVFGCLVTSAMVFSMATTLGGGLMIAVIGTVLTN